MDMPPFSAGTLILQLQDDPVEGVQKRLESYIRKFGDESERQDALLAYLRQLPSSDQPEGEDGQLPSPDDCVAETLVLREQLEGAAEALSRVKMAVELQGVWACEDCGINWTDRRQGHQSLHNGNNYSERLCKCGKPLHVAGSDALEDAVVDPAFAATYSLLSLNRRVESSILQAGLDLPPDLPAGSRALRGTQDLGR